MIEDESTGVLLALKNHSDRRPQTCLDGDITPDTELGLRETTGGVEPRISTMPPRYAAGTNRRSAQVESAEARLQPSPCNYRAYQGDPT